MPARDPRVDAYIAAAPAFAQPILTLIRAAVHEGCPDVVETMKWSRPHFDHHGIMCGMSAFKAHCAFGFWKGTQVVPDVQGEAMGQFGRITTVKDLPSRKALVGYVKTAALLNASGVKTERPKKAPAAQGADEAPPDLAAALAKRTHAKARATWEAFRPSHRREYVEWITGAKREETRARRLEITLAQLTEGKSQNWKYEKC